MEGGSMTTTLARTEWLAQARGLAPLIAQYREEGERERRLPAPVLSAAAAAGFWRMLLPRALGGEQAALVDALAVSEELGRHDASMAWNLTLAFLSPLFGDYLSEPAARGISGTQDAVVAGSFAPRGRAARVEGGYQLSGRWPFVSGCQHANWLVACAIVMEGDRPALGADGAPAPRMFLLPAEAGEVIDTWHTTGMRGTGSHDVAVADVFVPEERSFPFPAFFRGPERRPGQGYERPLMEIVPLFLAAVGLGVARDALASFTALAAAKTPTGMNSTLATQATVHERVGRAEALLRAAHCYLFATAAEVDAAGPERPPLVPPVRLAAAHAAQSAVELVGLLYQAAGGTSIYETSRLERCFRDINTLTHHVGIAPGAFVAAGEWLLQQAGA
jgi:alkylation response protein AidB-like acyl-CoA dehydrogenase